jgi:hypothetical protein
MSGAVVDKRLSPTVIANFELNVRSQAGEAGLDPTRAVEHGVGDHFV